jgi:hypothetical protein
MFSVAVELSDALALTDTSNRAHAAPAWGHNDAGSEFDDSGSIRQRAWLQVSSSSSNQTIPIFGCAQVLSSATDRFGRIELTGVHAVAGASSVRVDAPREWMALASPRSRCAFEAAIVAPVPLPVAEFSRELASRTAGIFTAGVARLGSDVDRQEWDSGYYRVVEPARALVALIVEGTIVEWSLRSVSYVIGAMMQSIGATTAVDSDSYVRVNLRE